MELDAFTCRLEALGRSPEERGRRRAFWILVLGGLCPNVAPADGEITHGRQLQQERVVKVWNLHPVVNRGKESSNAKFTRCRYAEFASCHKSQEKRHQMRISHRIVIGQWWHLPANPFWGTLSSRTSEETASTTVVRELYVVEKCTYIRLFRARCRHISSQNVLKTP